MIQGNIFSFLEFLIQEWFENNELSKKYSVKIDEIISSIYSFWTIADFDSLIKQKISVKFWSSAFDGYWLK